MGFNLGNFLNDNVFKQKDFKNAIDRIGGFGGTIINKGGQLLGNYFNLMMSATSGISKLLSSSMLPYVLIIAGVIIVGYKLKK